MQTAAPPLANPFLSPEFAIAAGRCRRESQVAVLTAGSDTIGFFPFDKRRLGVGVPIAGWLSACQGVIHTSDAPWSVPELLRGCQLSAWRYDNLVADQTPFEAYHSAISPAPVIDLSCGFSEYQAKLHARASHLSREIDRKSRKLSREVGVLRLVADCQEQAPLLLLMAWKSEQYRRTNHVDRFRQPWVVHLFRELLATRTEHLSGLLSVLYAGNQPVSVQFGLRAGSLLVGWFTGYDMRFRKYSPGMIQVRMMAEELPGLGVQTLHMGKGARRFTDSLKNSHILVGEGTATSQTLTGAAYRFGNMLHSHALHTVRKYPVLHNTADLMLRRTGVSSRTYGRI
jgi:CelD/BcsL family acetyltransferase involved in cellulose biosynthesis